MDKKKYLAIMLVGSAIPITERDLDHIKRKARSGFINPIHRLFSDGFDTQNPKNLVNFDYLVAVKDVDPEKYNPLIKQWESDRNKYVIETSKANFSIMLSGKDFRLLETRSKRYDTTPIINFIDSIDGTIVLNLKHVVHAYATAELPSSCKAEEK